MNWRGIWAVCLTVSLTAGSYEALASRRLLWKAGFCDTWGGTWVGYFCPDRDTAGGGGSGAQ